MYKKSLFLFLCAIVLSACGGGSDSAEPISSDPVRVNAGADFSLLEGESSELTGVASGGNGNYSYSWTAPDTVQITHPDTSLANASVLAPVVSTETSFTLTLSATDQEGKSGSKNVVLTVSPVNILPIATIQSNQLENYPSNSYPVNANIVLDASASSDADPQTAEPEIAAYLWQQVAGEDVLEGVQTNDATLQFTSPIDLEPSQIEFMLTVTDQEGGQATERITISLLGERGTLPDVEAGRTNSAFSGELLLLYGESSTQAPNAGALLTEWRHNFAGPLEIDEPEQLYTHVIAPMVSASTEIEFELNALDTFGNQLSDTVIYTVHPPIKSTLNDTGVSVNTNDTSIQTRFLHEYPGQDGHYGSDRIEGSGLLKKAGRGDAGFDFTRLNENGDPVDNLALPFSCVRDNVTGLVWESKDEIPNSIHNANNTYTWYQEEGSTGNFEGEINANSTSCPLDSGECNTQALLEEVNEKGLCGFFDWRIPSHQELQSILHYGRLSAPLVDIDYFPRSGAPINQAIWYWTSQTSADGVSDDTARNAWAIDFASGVDNFLNKSTEQKVRLVRAGRGSL